MSDMDPIDNRADIIDSRDIIARIEWLETCAELAGTVTELENGATIEHLALDEDEAHELKVLKALAEDAEGYAADWQYGESLIRDDYFQTYAGELAEDIGAFNRDAAWPLCHIDWEAATDSLRMDYTPVDFDGVTYWVR